MGKVSEKDIDTLARTLWGEARGEGYSGQVAVGWAVKNRVFDGKDKSWWGEGYAGVCLAPHQFSCWNKNHPNFKYLSGQVPIPAAQYAQARKAALDVINGQTDPTAGATHYHTTSIKTPVWAKGATVTARLGNHIFYRNVP